MGRGVAVAAAVAMLGGCMQAPMLVRHSGQADDRNALATRDMKPAQEFYAMVKPPTTAFEVLKNLKLAFEHDLLLRKDFYTGENLLHFSGGNKVEWREHTEGKQWVWISDFGAIAQPIRTKNFTYEGISWSAARTEEKNGKVVGEASLSLIMPNSGITFDQVERLFGKEWKPYYHSVILPERKIMPPTRPHGNDRIRYVLNSEHVARSVLMEFHSDATLYRTEFKEETE
jgi:hypothetical protein